MSPRQILGIIAACATVCAGVVTLLAMRGLPVPVAFLLVYAVALSSMIGMQRRARQASEGVDERDRADVPMRPDAAGGRTVSVPTVVAEPLHAVAGKAGY